ncbi:hypothetical protein [Frankia sp. CiP3]|uniref:hypothetical protein n=1 Tax=Frankia sp. CiP3 TaxID=2880971 RepID=UPI001EF3DFAD|nr:hypothetical protein [Frankia sp. CiP3]
MPDAPVSRRIMVADIESWSSRDSHTQKNLRQRLREVLNLAFAESGLPWREWADAVVSVADRGDGLLIVIPPNVPIVRLLDPFVDRLEVALRHDRRLHSEPARMRLRLAIHDGEVLAESSGWAGHDVIEACRLVEAEPLRQALRDEPEANVAVIVSERVHRGAVRDGYGSIRPETFTEVDVVVKTFRSRAWIHLPGITASRPATAAREKPPTNEVWRFYAFVATGVIAIVSIVAAVILVPAQGESSAATVPNAAGNRATAPVAGPATQAAFHRPAPPSLPASSRTDTLPPEPGPVATMTSPGPPRRPTASPPAPVTTPQLFGPSQANVGQSFHLSGTGWLPCQENTQISLVFDHAVISQRATLDASGAFDQLITVRADGGIGRDNSPRYIYLTPGQHKIQAKAIDGQNCTRERPIITLTIT